MIVWDKQHEGYAWGKSLLLKSGVLGLGLVVVMLAGWPQPQIGLFHDAAAPILLSKATLNSGVHQESNPVPFVSRGELFTATREKPNFQIAPVPFLIDLNGSSQKELESLPGIGVVLASRIVTHRKRYGGFQRVEDLVNVSGIGIKRLKGLELLVTVEAKSRDIKS